jgi:hypothetical protein
MKIERNKILSLGDKISEMPGKMKKREEFPNLEPASVSKFTSKGRHEYTVKFDRS